ncbi:MAG: lactonase family protein [Gammaproteobacteria bacterium]|nr:lactonase family protein [Gammaproteobacteria bacterium]
MTRTFFYAAIGAKLRPYTINIDDAALRAGEAIELPARVQYVWAHPTKPALYVIYSNGGPGHRPGDFHQAAAFAVDPETGRLSALGAPTDLPTRPIHCTVDETGGFLLIAYNVPSLVTVHRIAHDGSLDSQVSQPTELDAGIFAHQIRMVPGNRSAIIVARGNDETDSSNEDPGGLRLFDFADGVLSNGSTIAPNDGFGFGPRHLDFHPNGRWVYVSVERQDELHLFELDDAGKLSALPTHTVSSLRDPDNRQGPQLACAVHVHPNGRYVYQANRTDGLVRDSNGWPISQGGEDSLVVYEIDQRDGRPVPVQHIATGSIHPRTFSIHPSGQLLVAATIQAVPVKTDAQSVKLVPAALLVYRIAVDGRLTLATTYEINTRGDLMFWTGMLDIRG